MKKILIIGTGGTIACSGGDVIGLDKPFKVLDCYDNNDVEFECASPFFTLSENIDFKNWKTLIDFIKATDTSLFVGIIILHGSDTLAFTSAVLANIFYDENICVTASDKPVEDLSSNALKNFAGAVDYILSGKSGVAVSFDGIKAGGCITSADESDTFLSVGKPLKRIENPVFSPKNILIVRPYVNIDYNDFSLDGVDAVLHTMYHSATAPKAVLDFYEKCKSKGIPFYFVTAKDEALYSSASDFQNVLFSTTLENAYARLLCTDNLSVFD